jgi:hypothetical protein
MANEVTNRKQSTVWHSTVLGIQSDCRAKRLCYPMLSVDGVAKSPFAVIPDLIRDPEVIDITGFPPSRE